MARVDGGILYSSDQLRAWTQDIFRKIGVGIDDATLLTDHMIEANLRGVDIHGITRMLCVYAERIRRGVMNPARALHGRAGKSLHRANRLPQQHRPGRGGEGHADGNRKGTADWRRPYGCHTL